jgi:hypothetical protein
MLLLNVLVGVLDIFGHDHDGDHEKKMSDHYLEGLNVGSSVEISEKATDENFRNSVLELCLLRKVQFPKFP